MANATAGTEAISMTITEARTTLLATQFGVIMRRLTDNSKESIKEYKACLMERKLSEVIFCAMGPNDVCLGRLHFRIDWSEHEAQIKANGDMVNVKSKYLQGDEVILPEIDEVCDTMEDLLDSGNATIDIYSKIVPEYTDEVCSRLHLVPATLPHVNGCDENFSPRELSEIKMKLVLNAS